MALVIVAWIAAEFGLLVIELSKTGLITKPEVIAVAAVMALESLPRPNEL